MKRNLFLICVGVLGVALTATAAPKRAKETTVVAKKASSAQVVSPKSRNVGQMRHASVQRKSSIAGMRQQSYTTKQHVKTNAVVHHNNAQMARSKTVRNRDLNVTKTPHVKTNAVGHHNNAQIAHAKKVQNRNLNATNTAKTHNNLTVNRGRNIHNNVNRTRKVAINNNWKGAGFNGAHYAAFRNYHRQWHDRGWWNNHCSRVVFISGGWWAWNAGYWYPAWGYDPYYSSYGYDGPIYTGYATLSPDRVVVNVQEQLQRDGYYYGQIDGILGPETRQALAAFQSDQGLAITSSVDQPTLASLGLS